MIEDEVLNGLKKVGGSVDWYVKNQAGQVLSIDSDGTNFGVSEFQTHSFSVLPS